MKKHTRVLSLLLALVMVCALAPTMAAAADEAPAQGTFTCKEAIAPQYEAARAFSEELAAVKQDGKWGYIDKTGTTVVPFIYDLAYTFNEGYAVVGTLEHDVAYTEEEWDEELMDYKQVTKTHDVYHLGFIDKAGSYKPFTVDYEDENGQTATYEATRDLDTVRTDYGDYVFHNGYAVIYNRSYDSAWGDWWQWSDVFDATGRKVDEGHTGAWAVNEGILIKAGLDINSYYYVDLETEKSFHPDRGPDDPVGAIHSKYGNGSVYIPPETSNYALRPFNQGLAPVYALPDKGWGFVDKQGDWVIEPVAGRELIWIWNSNTDFQIFGENGVAVLGDSEGHFGGIDKTGKTVVPFEYDALFQAIEGTMAFQKDGKWGYLDADTLQVAIPAQFDIATTFNNGYTIVGTRNSDGTLAAQLIDRSGAPIPGGEKLDVETYFYVDEDTGYEGVRSPDEYLITRENGKYGYIAVVGSAQTPAQDVTPPPATNMTEEEARAIIEALKSEYPEGMSWTNDNGYHYSEGLRTSGYGCAAFAFICSDAVFGDAPATETHSDFDRIRVGDILRINNDTHSVVVLEKKADSVIVAEGNYNKAIHWGREISRAKLEARGLQVTTRWSDKAPQGSVPTAYASTQTVTVDGKPVTFHAYALKDANGNDTNYIKLRDVADVLSGSAAQFQVGWDGSITITTKTAYTPNGTEMVQNFTGNQSYAVSTSPVTINGVSADLEAITLTDANGGGYTYFKLRDLGAALGFNVSWSADTGITIDPNSPYNAND